MRSKPLHFFRTVLLLLLGLGTTVQVNAQTINTTVGSTGYNGGNNSGANGFITFVINNNSGTDILLTDVGDWSGTAENGDTYTLYYSSTSLSGPVTHSGNVPSGPDWTSVGSGVAAGITSTQVNPVITGMTFLIPDGQTYRFALHTTGTNYYSGAAGPPAPDSFTVSGVNLYVGAYQINGQNVGYGVGNNPRWFTGSVSWIPATACSGTPVAGTAVSTVPAVCPGSSATLTLAGATLAGGLTYQWEESPAGANMWMPIAGGTSASISVSPTSPTDYRAVVTCINGGLADISAPVTIGINTFINCYCTSGASNAFDGEITNVTVGSLNNSSTCAASNQLYTDFTTSVPAVQLMQTGSYPVSVMAGSCGGSYSAYVKIFIDLDQDGTFTGAGEEVFAGVPPGGLYTPTGVAATGVLTIPATATTGLTRMRVILNQTTSASAVTPCGTYNYGETEDYLVEVMAATACSGIPVAGTASGPSNICAGTPFNITLAGTTIGTGIQVQWEESPAGANTWTAIPSATTTVLSIASQTTATDYRAIVTCTNGGQTDISNTVSVAQNAPTTCYCTPVYTTACTVGDDIDDFILAGDVLPGINNLNTPCPTGGYQDFTSMSATLSAGLTYTGNLTTNYGSASEDARIWIDYDLNGIFDATEEIAVLDNLSNASTGSFTFTVPASATPGTYRLRARLVFAAAGGGAGIDPCMSYTYGEAHDYMVNIVPPPSCLPPTNAIAGTFLSTSGSVSWTASTSAPANGYEWRVFPQGTGPYGTPTASGTTSTAVTTAAVTGLTPATSYTFYVRGHCSASDSSNWIAVNLVTACAAVPAPYIHDVESQNVNTNSVMTNCWTSSPTGSSSVYAWHVSGGTTSSTNTGPAVAHSGSKYFFTEASYGTLGAIAELTTPEIDVTTLTLPMLEFWYHMYGPDMNKLVVSVFDGTVWTPVDSLVGQQQTAEADPWLKRSVVLSGYTGTIQVRFTGVRGNSFGGDISIDDIAVIDAPTCVPPTSITTSNITSSSVDISWPAAATTASGYEWAIDQTSTPAPDASTTINTTTGTGPVTASGLTGGTYYYLHLRSDCGTTNGLSAWAVYTIALPPANDECVNAINITSSLITPGTTVGATESLPSGSCATTTTYANDVWYWFNTGSGTVTVTASNTVGDVVLEVFSGTCGALTSVDCQDIPAIGTETSVINATAGTYWVRVYGFLSVENPFTVQVTGTPLSIDFGKLSATNVGTRNRIDWNTLSETPGDKFEIERSRDGRNFIPQATVSAKGEASVYTWWDEQPATGTNYYRIKVLDLNGSIQYSEIVSVEVSGKFAVEAFPNPVSNLLHVRVTETAANATVTVSDITGKTVRVVSVEDNKAEINMAGMAQGVYLIKYSDAQRTETLKINKQ